jgi:heat shock protein HslJ
MRDLSFLTVALVVGSTGLAMAGDLTGAHWRPSEIKSSELPAETPLYLEFKDGQVTGYGGCNRFFAGYAISGDAIKIGPLASTRKGCPDTFDLEIAFFTALQAAKSFQQTEDGLVLFDAGGRRLATFVAGKSG